MIDEVGDETARMSARQLFLQPRPVAPELPEERLLLLLRWPIKLVWSGERELQSVLEASLDERFRQERLAVANGAEALVVEIIRHPARGRLVEGDPAQFRIGGREAAEDDLEPVRPNVLR